MNPSNAQFELEYMHPKLGKSAGNTKTDTVETKAAAKSLPSRFQPVFPMQKQPVEPKNSFVAQWNLEPRTHIFFTGFYGLITGSLRVNYGFLKTRFFRAPKKYGFSTGYLRVIWLKTRFFRPEPIIYHIFSQKSIKCHMLSDSKGYRSPKNLKMIVYPQEFRFHSKYIAGHYSSK